MLQEQEQEQYKPFDLDRWLAEAAHGREALIKRRSELTFKRREIDEELVEIEDRLDRINQLLGDDPGSSGRKQGVLDLVRKLLIEQHAANPNEAWSEETLIQAVLRQDPMMKNGSIMSAVRRLVSEGTVERIGKRGHRSYRWIPMAVTMASPPEPIDQARTALVSAGRKGISLKEMAWKLSDGADANVVIGQLMDNGEAQAIDTGSGERRYRFVSRSEMPPPLPSERQTGMRFPNADRPDGV